MDERSHAQLEEELARWTARGAISREQADAIRNIEQEVAAVPRGRIPLVAQAIGFLGGALAVIAGIVATSRFWDDMPTAARLGLVGAVAVLLVVVGRVVRRDEEPALANLGSFLWLLAMGCVAFWVGIFATDVVNLEGADVATAIGVVSLVVAGALWRWRAAPLQHVATFAALALSVASVAGHVEHVGALFVGIALWAVGVSWIVLAWMGVVSPAPVAYVVGALVAIGAGGAVGADGRWGDILAVATVVAFLAASVPTRSMVLLWVGVLGIFQAVPTAITRHFGDSLGAPLILFLVGLSLIGAAVVASRLAPEIRSAPPKLAHLSQRSIGAGLLAAVAVVVAVTVGFTDVRPAPAYPSLQQTPDPSLVGSVAFVRDGNKPCVYVMAASGTAAAKKLYCDAHLDHGPMGLSWDGGNVLVHSWTEQSGSQVITVDGATGRVLNRASVSDEYKDIPPSMRRADGTVVEIQGRHGAPRVVLRSSAGVTRTVLRPVGPRDYWLEEAVWSPDGIHLIVTDSEHRMLIVDTESPVHTTRVLVTHAMWPAWSAA
ncbi:MAG TPA: DUF2157 domain-containing protein [Acidimicrobiales bacterium]|nr:DUF2157 domain-containing protein [Acidimicrobiales bacterium]